ncbi:hypothetical protein [Parafilimonas terrae]|uniref:Uncharacterized protein n=1 Tax=Parafilimonas terrae TaxID=1465490 RepID=A0A1I5ZJ28_9BACT|nr:hypothetical protein [Parafilimonas terrae]SFQ56373.1 hypothetical protein SAMN05444277_1363 [Parafilimonas terrae]
MENKAKIRINLNAREFEIEGTEEFINSHSEKIDSFLEILKSIPVNQLPPQQPTPPAVVVNNQPITGQVQPPANGLPESFGEYFHSLPNNAKDVDKVLLAGHFAQAQNEQNTFTTLEATKLLLDQGVRLTNPSQAIKNNTDAKRLIKISKGKFRVSKDGSDFLKKFLTNSAD